MLRVPKSRAALFPGPAPQAGREGHPAKQDCPARGHAAGRRKAGEKQEAPLHVFLHTPGNDGA